VHYLAETYAGMNEPAKAEPLYKRSLEIREKALGPNHFEIGNTCYNWANFYIGHGDGVHAEPLLKRALAVYERSLPPDHPNVAMVLNGLAGLLIDKGNVDEAEPYARRALAIQEKSLGPDHPSLAAPLTGLASINLIRGKCAEAETLYRRALKLAEGKAAGLHMLIPTINLGLGQAIKEQKRYDQAIPILRESLEGFTKFNDPHAQEAELQLIEAMIYAKDFSAAEPLARKVWEKAKPTTEPAPDAHLLDQAATLMTELYDGMGKSDQADSYRKYKAAATQPSTAPASQPSR
jgi:tetratricopeptide (TPR) repeat protein